jgi:hypothetical protein
VLPKVKKSNTDNRDAIRAKDRIDIADPMWTCDKIAIDDPNRAKQRNEIELPTFM